MATVHIFQHDGFRVTIRKVGEEYFADVKNQHASTTDGAVDMGDEIIFGPYAEDAPAAAAAKDAIDKKIVR